MPYNADPTGLSVRILQARTPAEHQRLIPFTDPDFLAKIPPSCQHPVFIGASPETIPPGETHTFTVEVFRATRIERILIDGPGAGYHIAVVDCAPFPLPDPRQPAFHPTPGASWWECRLEPRIVAAADPGQPAHARLCVTLRNVDRGSALIAFALHGIELV